MGCSSSKNVELSNDDLEFLVQHTTYTKDNIQQWYKGFKQDCPNGKLTREKFLEIYKVFFSSGNPEKFCDHVFRTFDTDKNGYIDFKEFLLSVGVTSSNSSDVRLKWAFKMYDINGDGHIEKPEMTKIVKALYEMLGPGTDDIPDDTAEESANVIFQKMDTNKDGKLSIEEFISGCLEDDKISKLLSINPDDAKRCMETSYNSVSV